MVEHQIPLPLGSRTGLSDPGSSAALTHRLVSHFDPEVIGIIHDAGNMANKGFEDYRLGLELLGSYLAHIHLKNAAYDRPTTAGTWQPRWSPLEDGTVDFPKLFGALAAMGYDSWLGTEDFSVVRDSRAALKHNHTFVQKLVREQVSR